MTHLDPETLALLALGEDAATATERLHLAGCAQCRDEVARFARAVAATRDADEPLTKPGPQVWAGIAEALELPADLTADPLGEVGPRAVPTLARRRPRGLGAALLAAAAVLVLGGVGVGLLISQHQVTAVATATLHAFPGWRGDSGMAVLERLPDGRQIVQVTTTVRPDGTTDHEVWLMTAGAKRRRR